jgi:CubicO group peptidase (beta-lactamase class C family)
MTENRAGGAAERHPHVRAALRERMEADAVPGLVAVIADRERAWIEPMGTLSAGDSPPVLADSIFRISSMTKPITAAATLVLVEEGRLALDAPVERWIPELADRRVLRRPDGPLTETEPARRPITVEDLLTFRLGFGIPLVGPGEWPVADALEALTLGQGPPHPDGVPAPDEWVRRFATLPLIYQPGERWMYNTGSDLLGVLLARATGEPFDAVLRGRIFEPLGMRDTGFCVPRSKLPRVTTSYGRPGAPKDLAAVYDPPDGQWSRPPAFPSGGGGLASTAPDFLAFARMLLASGRSGGRPLLSPRSVQAMTRDHLTPGQRAAGGVFGNPSLGWGYGIAVATTAGPEFGPGGSYGWDGGMGTTWRTHPSEGRILLLLTERCFVSPQPPAIHPAFWQAVLRAEPG